MHNGYTTVQAIRAQGFNDPGWDTTVYDDTFIQALISAAAEEIDRFTNNFFEPRTLTIHRDGNNRRMLPVRPVMHSLSGAVITIDGSELSGTNLTDAVELVNLDNDQSQQVLMGKSTSWTWPLPYGRGDRNIRIMSPDFGWYEDDDSPVQAPALIQQANIHLVAREIIKSYKSSTSTQTSAQGAVKKVKVDISEKEYFESKGEGSIAKPLSEILAILNLFRSDEPTFSVVEF